MKVKRFDLYEELWTKSRTAYCNEHDLEFENLKEIIKEHDIPLLPSNYLYHYRKGNILPRYPIQGDNYEIFLVHRKSEKDKLFEKWRYFDDEKKEELFAIYSNIKLPERVGRYHKLIVGHREYVKEQKRLDREAERHPFARRNFNNKQQNVLNTHRISDKTLSDFYVLTDTLFKALESAGCTVSVNDKRIVVKLKSAKEVNKLNSKNGTPSKVFATDFTFLLHFRDKNNRIKNEEGKYPPHFDKPTGQFRCELTGCYPWSESYGIDRNFQGNYNAEELLKILFAKIFEMAQLLYEEKMKHDREVAERKREEEAAERAKNDREKEFNDIKELLHEYKVHKELTGLKEFIKSTKAPKASMEEMLWYKATLKWLDDASRMDNGLSQYQHQDLINYLLDEKTTNETVFNDNRYRW